MFLIRKHTSYVSISVLSFNIGSLLTPPLPSVLLNHFHMQVYRVMCIPVFAYAICHLTAIPSLPPAPVGAVLQPHTS